jgi:hypothetical protein
VNTPYKPPGFGESAFNCPHCGAFAKQQWVEITSVHQAGSSSGWNVGSSPRFSEITEWRFSLCDHCGRVCTWQKETLVRPAASTAPMHHEDMPDDVADDYDEARDVLNASPRAAAALLRLALQRLMPHLGVTSTNLNEDIGALVSQGLPAQVQQALDTLRVVGNNAVHPGEIDLKDDPETASALFELLNFVVEDRISRPQAISGLFASLPAGARDAVAKRDGL